MAGAERLHSQAVTRAAHHRNGIDRFGMLCGGALVLSIALATGCHEPAEETVTPVEIRPHEVSPAAATVEKLRVQVIRTYPHDPEAFTQGLIWHAGLMYESSGRYGQSSLRKVRLEDGRVLAQRKLEASYFGEGLERVGERLIQLTWRSGVAIVSDLATLERRETLAYRGEGWGLCYNGSELVMSDGSSTLEFRDPESLEILRETSVLRNGRPVAKLNELECVGSVIYANIWQRDEIVRIDANTGLVTASIDASGLLSRVEAFRADVLNGIAYKSESETFLLTGKLWPHVFEVTFVPR